MQLLGGGIGMLFDQLRQLLKIDLDNSGPAPWPRPRLASFPAALFNPPRPGSTDLEQVGDLLRLQAAIVSREHAIPQILTIGNTHPWLLSGPILEPEKSLRAGSAGRNPNKRRTRYDWIAPALARMLHDLV